MRLLLGAFGDPGHAFPMIGLGRALARRGHDVALETWAQWREPIEAAGMEFIAAPEYPVFPTRGRPLGPYEAVVRAAGETLRAIEHFGPDAVVADILTLAPALAAELAGITAATLVPHVYPHTLREHPPYSLGARMPRTSAGRLLWRGFAGGVDRGLRRGRDELNAARAELGLPPTARLHGGLSERLCIVATFPQLEYPREWPPGTHVVGPVLWEPAGAPAEPPSGDDPLVLVAPSTSQDPRHTLVRAALDGLAREPVRVLAATNRRPLHEPLPVPPNARVVDWVSYSAMLPRCALAIAHGGHGTVMRALAEGVPLVACPAAGDMNENAARIDWAGAGVRVPRALLSPRALRLAVRRALGDPRLAARARELAAWARAHDGAERAAELVEQLA